MKNTYLEVKNLSKNIKGSMVLSNINLNLYKGRIYGFRGKNGSGKTMLFRAICGLIKTTGGEVIINGEVLGKDISFPREVGVLIENPGFLAALTGYKNLKYLADIKKITNKSKIMETLEDVGLNPKDQRKFKKYSLGMKQRLGIAQAIMEEPELIILDEPTNALDSEGIKLINDIILKLKSEGKLILIANHDKEELDEIADEIYTIELGKIIGHEVIREKNNDKEEICNDNL